MIRGWLSKVVRKEPPAPPPEEPFRVVCECTATVTGMRAAQPQKPRCQVCGRMVFVLPLNVYPGPIPQPAVRQKVPERRATPPAPPPRPVLAQAETAPQVPVLVEVRSPWWTPLRLVTLSLIVVVALSGWLGWRQIRRSVAQQSLAGAREAGLAAFAQSDFLTAARELGRARSAIEVLGLNDEAARATTQAAAEAQVAAGLVTATLPELVEVGLKVARDDAAAAREWRALYAGQWLLLDGELRLEVNREGETQVLFDTGVRVQKLPVRIDLSRSVLRRWIETRAAEQAAAGTSTTPGAVLPPAGLKRAIFGVRLDSVRLVQEPAPAVELSALPESVVLWESIAHYLLLGYDTDTEEERLGTVELLRLQHEFQEPQK